jgi:oligopeptide/dipeptide ABC transporter ATP-binding protein
MLPSPAGPDVASPGQFSPRPPDGPALLEVTDLRVGFPSRGGLILAVDGISFELRPGEILALVGESGSGKSVCALSILKLVPYPGRYLAGAIRLHGKEVLALDEQHLAALRGRKVALVQQQPRAALNPAFRIGRQLARTLRRTTGCSRAEAADRAAAALAEVGFPDPAQVLTSFPHELSGGMCQRVCLALALAGAADCLIADEPTTMLDVAVQAQVLLLLRRLNRERGLAILLVTHDLALVRALADRVLVLYGGQVQESGTVDQVLGAPSHPYTRALIAGMPDPARGAARLQAIDGQPGVARATDQGCRFAPRCRLAVPPCRTMRPALQPLAAGQAARCHLLPQAAELAS